MRAWGDGFGIRAHVKDRLEDEELQLLKGFGFSSFALQFRE